MYSPIHFGECTLAGRRNAVHPPASSPTFCRRFAHPGPDKALFLEAIKPRIDRPDGYILTGTFHQFPANRCSVSIVFEPQDRQQQEMFESAKQSITGHNNCIVVQNSSEVKK
jgi:hypothetical protein